MSDKVDPLPVWLLTNLPIAPANLLLGGKIKDAWVSELQARHYAVALAGKPFCAPMATRQDPGSDLENYQAIVTVGLTPLLDPLHLFGTAYSLLADHGWLLLLEPVVPKPYPTEYRGLMRQEYVTTLAARAGFQLVKEKQLEKTPTYTHFFRFLKTKVRRWRISHIDHCDKKAIADLFCKVFGHAMDAALWTWKYGQGRGQGVIAWKQRKIIAHYGGITRKVIYRGQPKLFCQIADVMVDQTERGILTRKGAFFLTAASYPELYTGYGAKHLIGFGFPNDRHFRLSERLGLYGWVGKILELAWEPVEKNGFLRQQCDDYTKFSPSQAQVKVTKLWQSMATDLKEGIVGCRDTEWIQHRYLDHPHHHYQILLIEGGIPRRPKGMIVLRKVDKRTEWLDLIAPLQHIPKLVVAARQQAKKNGSQELFCWVSAAYKHYFGPVSYERDPKIVVPTSTWTPAPDPKEIQNRWWLMGGDTDFR